MRYLIIPDVHGRKFWEKPVLEALKDDNTHIIFLGDYLDPYPDEWEYEIPITALAIDNFKTILGLKRDNPDKITLLQGNHDLGYVIPVICKCRRDVSNYNEIRSLFLDNKHLFQIAYETTINDKRYVFSHAGISKEWIDSYSEGITEENVVDFLNSEFSSMMDNRPNKHKFSDALSMCSIDRGGWDECGSIVWAGIYEWYEKRATPFGGYQIFGHSRSRGEIITEDFAMIDCRKAFILNEDGTLNAINSSEQ